MSEDKYYLKKLKMGPPSPKRVATKEHRKGKLKVKESDKTKRAWEVEKRLRAKTEEAAILGGKSYEKDIEAAIGRRVIELMTPKKRSKAIEKALKK